MNKSIDEKVQQLEDDVKYKIIEIEDETNDHTSSQAKDKIDQLIQDFKDWLENHKNDPELNARFQKLQQDIQNVLEKCSTKVNDFLNQDGVIKAKETVLKAGDQVGDTVSKGFEALKNQEYVKKGLDSVHDAVDSFQKNENVQKNLKKMKKGTLKVLDQTYDCLKRVLNSKDDEEL